MRTAETTANVASVLTFAALLGGCLEHPLKKVGLEKVVNGGVTIPLNDNRDVDILFVIDNSGSMAEEQARLARNFPAFVAGLEAMNADFRIAMTTTDVDHPACPQATPEDGALVLRSCVDAVAAGAFVFNDEDAAYACTDQCKLTPEQLQIQPSAASDDESVPRPWLESISGVTNLPAGVSVADAFACFGPQGIDGCGYESTLEAMRLALTKGREKGGFLRDEAILSVVVVTDEADCSFNPEHGEVFTSEPTFWNADDPQRTSGICWRAGVQCEGPGPVYDGCRAADFDAKGQPTAEDDAAVLFPIRRYVDFLDGLRLQPGTARGAREVLVSLITGVPVGYDSGAAELVYQDAEPGSEQQINFGVAPGCINTEDGSGSTAIPPVREREVAEAFATDEERNLFSICQDDYSPALAQIAKKIQQELRPVCGDICWEDADPETAELEPTCEVSQIVDGESRRLQPCVREGDAWAQPAGADICFVLLTDPDGRTAQTWDDMTVEAGQDAPTCSNDETNVEFALHRRGPRTPGATYSATCLAAADQDSCKRD